jgi:hypothetical protein
VEKTADTASTPNAVVNPFFVVVGGSVWDIRISRGLSLERAIQVDPTSFLDTQVSSGLRERIMLNMDVQPAGNFGVIVIDEFVEEQETIRALLVRILSKMSETIPDFEKGVGLDFSMQIMDPL